MNQWVTHPMWLKFAAFRVPGRKIKKAATTEASLKLFFKAPPNSGRPKPYPFPAVQFSFAHGLWVKNSLTTVTYFANLMLLFKSQSRSSEDNPNNAQPNMR